MNTLDELNYYINDRNPIGAIMLIGKWGCSKSYLIEHNLRGEVQSSHILLRISLFGIVSVEEIKETVKKEWVSQYILQERRRRRLSRKKEKPMSQKMFKVI